MFVDTCFNPLLPAGECLAAPERATELGEVDQMVVSTVGSIPALFEQVEQGNLGDHVVLNGRTLSILKKSECTCPLEWADTPIVPVPETAIGSAKGLFKLRRPGSKTTVCAATGTNSPDVCISDGVLQLQAEACICFDATCRSFRLSSMVVRGGVVVCRGRGCRLNFTSTKFERCSLVILDGAQVTLQDSSFYDSALGIFASGCDTVVTAQGLSVCAGIQSLLVCKGARVDCSAARFIAWKGRGITAGDKKTQLNLIDATFQPGYCPDSELQNNRLHALWVHSSSTCTAQKCKFSGSWRLICISSARASITDSTLGASLSAAVHVDKEGQVSMLRCTIKSVQTHHGLFISGAGSSATATDCKFNSNGASGVAVFTQGKAVLNSCTSSRNHGAGFEMRNGGVLHLYDCKSEDDNTGVRGASGNLSAHRVSVSNPSERGFEIIAGCQAQLKLSTCTVAGRVEKSCGLAVSDVGTVVRVEDCQFRGGGGYGIKVQLSARLTCTRVTCSGNKEAGVLAHTLAVLEMNACVCEKNRYGCCVLGKSELRANKLEVRNCSCDGLEIQQEATANLVGCTVSNCKQRCVFAHSNSDVHLEDSAISGGDIGLWFSKCKVKVSDCRVFGCSLIGVRGESKSKLQITDTVISVCEHDSGVEPVPGSDMCIDHLSAGMIEQLKLGIQGIGDLSEVDGVLEKAWKVQGKCVDASIARTGLKTIDCVVSCNSMKIRGEGVIRSGISMRGCTARFVGCQVVGCTDLGVYIIVGNVTVQQCVVDGAGQCFVADGSDGSTRVQANDCDFTRGVTACVSVMGGAYGKLVGCRMKDAVGSESAALFVGVGVAEVEAMECEFASNRGWAASVREYGVVKLKSCRTLRNAKGGFWAMGGRIELRGCSCDGDGGAAGVGAAGEGSSVFAEEVTVRNAEGNGFQCVQDASVELVSCVAQDCGHTGVVSTSGGRLTASGVKMEATEQGLVVSGAWAMAVDCEMVSCRVEGVAIDCEGSLQMMRCVLHGKKTCVLGLRVIHEGSVAEVRECKFLEHAQFGTCVVAGGCCSLTGCESKCNGTAGFYVDETNLREDANGKVNGPPAFIKLRNCRSFGDRNGAMAKMGAKLQAEMLVISQTTGDGMLCDLSPESEVSLKDCVIKRCHGNGFATKGSGGECFLEKVEVLNCGGAGVLAHIGSTIRCTAVKSFGNHTGFGALGESSKLFLEECSSDGTHPYCYEDGGCLHVDRCNPMPTHTEVAQVQKPTFVPFLGSGED